MAETKIVIRQTDLVQPNCLAYRTGTQLIPNAAHTVVSLNLELFDTDDMHDNVTNNSRITIKTAGKYILNASVQFVPNGTGQRQIQIWKNGAAMARVFVGSIPTFNSRLNVTAIVDGVVDDYYELYVWQNSTISLNIDAGSGNTNLSAIKVS